MMIDLNALETYRENNRIEAKTALGGLPHSIWETYSAFANALGGIILLGVQEWRDKTFHLVDLPDPESLVREFLDKVRDPKYANVNILSPDDVQTETVEGNHIIIIHVPRANRLQKPVFVEGNLKNTYRRSGEGDYRCSREEIEAMQRDAAAVSRDMTVLNDFSCSVFNRNTLRRFHTCLRLSHPEYSLRGTKLLQDIGAAGVGADGRVHPTAAGLLLFGNAADICRQFPCYGLKYSVCGKTRLESGSGRWSGNILDFYLRLCKKIITDAKTENDFSLKEESVRRAVSEALANCLVHADYEGQCGISVDLDADEIRFANPGCFRVEPEAARRNGMSDPRNSVLNHVFNLMGIRKHNASGLPGICSVWKEQKREEPQICQMFAPDLTILILPLFPDDPQTRSGAQVLTVPVIKQLIIVYLTERISGSTAEIAEFLGVSSVRTRRILDQMLCENLLETEKSGRSRLYKLKA